MKKRKTVCALALALTTLFAAGSPADIQAAGSHDMYRVYNPNSGEHFYTAYQRELYNLIAHGWQYEGVGWNAPDEGWYVYRLYNPNAGDHHYTMDVNECNMLIDKGWKYEGVGWASPSLGWEDPEKAEGVPVYRLYNPYAATATHHYTKDAQEANKLIDLGWKYEGIGWYAVR